MSTVGLTKAKERALDYAKRDRYDLIKRPTWVRLREAELVDRDGKLTPRGHAALAAPRMTQAEFDLLERWELGYVYGGGRRGVASARTRVEMAMQKKGWLSYGPTLQSRLTPAGRTVLNNVRAAMPGPWSPLVETKEAA